MIYLRFCTLATLCCLLIPLVCVAQAPTGRQYRWTRENTDQTQWATDDYACKKENERPYTRTVPSPMAQNPLWALGQSLQGKDSNAPVGIESGVEVNQQMYVACMQARGYSYTIEEKK